MKLEYCIDKYGFKWIVVDTEDCGVGKFPYLDIINDSHAIACYNEAGDERLCYTSDFKGCKKYMLDRIKRTGSARIYTGAKLHIVKLNNKAKRYWSKHPFVNSISNPKIMDESERYTI